MTKVNEEVSIVIFGASGDLNKRKLMPALSELFKVKVFTTHFNIVGFSRTDFSDDAFVEHLKKTSPYKDIGADFFTHVSYVSGSYDSLEDFKKLAEHLKSRPQNRLFYMAVPPEQVMSICENLSATGLCTKEKKNHFERIIFEKPFGTNYESSKELNQKLLQFFNEEQIYRIDHYLGKETVQNIMAFRFANIIFEPLWNRSFVDYIDINVSEELGIVGRGEYFDHTGITRDVIQNHALQLLAMVAMEAPANLNATAIRNEKVKLLSSIPAPLASLRGQYEGYHDEQGVKKNSQTETFSALKLSIENWRWADTPIYIRAGKALMEKSTEVSIFFKRVPHKLFKSAHINAIEPNALVFKIQPKEGIHLYFQSKNPGSGFKLSPVDMDFSYHNEYVSRISDAYERLLLDALLGDASLFIRGDEVEASWKIVDPVLKSCEENKEIPLHSYKKGQLGPDEMFDFIGKDGHAWNQSICRLKL